MKDLVRVINWKIRVLVTTEFREVSLGLPGVWELLAEPELSEE